MSRVLVLGGGIASLAAGHALTRATPAPRVTVVRASPRLGGKLHTKCVDGFLVEAGADWFGAAWYAPVLWTSSGKIGLRRRVASPRLRRDGC